MVMRVTKTLRCSHTVSLRLKGVLSGIFVDLSVSGGGGP